MRIKYSNEQDRKEAIKETKRNWYKRNSGSVLKQQLKYKNSEFYVYKHYNSKGDLYIGSGQKCRCNDFREEQRTKQWLTAFKEECNVEILRKTKTREEARELESLIIDTIGIENLINSRRV